MSGTIAFLMLILVRGKKKKGGEKDAGMPRVGSMGWVKKEEARA